MKKTSKRGTSLYLGLMIMTILLAVALGVSTIFLGQMKSIREMGYSVIAFYAADAGIEEVLMNRSNPSSPCTESSPCSLDNGSEYYINVRASGSNCEANYYCVKSVGVYKGIRRAIEITY